MPRFDPETHSFVIKLWLEQAQTEAGHPAWRGRITHVASGNHYYIKDLSSIVFIIGPYLEEMKVNLGMGWRLSQWLRQIKLNLLRQNK